MLMVGIGVVIIIWSRSLLPFHSFLTAPVEPVEQDDAVEADTHGDLGRGFSDVYTIPNRVKIGTGTLTREGGVRCHGARRRLRLCANTLFKAQAITMPFPTRLVLKKSDL